MGQSEPSYGRLRVSRPTDYNSGDPLNLALIGLSHTTGQITHHNASDLEGRNGGGDRWFTDGRLCVGIIEAPNVEQVAP